MLHDLVRYYEILAEQEGSGIPKKGYGTANITFALNIDDDGNLINLTSCKIASGKKLVPKPMTVPEPVKGKTSKILPEFLFGNSAYILGIDDKGNPGRAKACFEAFKEYNIPILRNAQCKEADVVIKFLENWVPEKALEHPSINDNIEEIYKGAVFIFRYNGQQDVHNVQQIKKAWMQEYQNRSSGIMRQCLVTGKIAPVAVLHSQIKGLYNGLPTGNTLVSYNDTAYESFNATKERKQGLNGPVSEYAEFAYTTTLNALVADDSHKLLLGDTTVVFWAEATEKIYPDMLSLFLNCSELYVEDDKKRVVRSPEAEKVVKTVLERIAQGKRTDFEDVYAKTLDRDMRFYVLGMSPNSARISIRFYLKGTFGSFEEKIRQHYADLAMQRQFDSDMPNIPVWKILKETLSKASVEKAASTYLSTSLMRAVLLGEDYPNSLYQMILLRIHTEHDVNYYKAAIIKACLLRKARRYGNNEYKEVLTLSLNENTTNKAYHLGRLFAVLEKAQLDANPDINTTISDKYLSSASTTPRSTFPDLLTRVQYHISKLDHGVYYSKLIGQIMDKLDPDNDPFPITLSLDEQGLFFLGFYHQRNKFYEKKDKQDQ